MKDITLLEEYKKLWNNRSFTVDKGNEIDVLVSSIKSELLDEATHPRLRRAKEDKLLLAINRIMGSDMTDIAKVKIIQYYVQQFQQLENN
ncbi:hypothetical protein WAK64_09780 [Bacillus spongiae]|uniref:Uncharacterized protein n=1 Tax=Bacillus spongiae TaxID=2683610 RepID=A0ABU8HDT8_9BACI